MTNTSPSRTSATSAGQPPTEAFRSFQETLSAFQNEVSSRKHSLESRKQQSADARKLCTDLVMHNMVFASTLRELTCAVLSQLRARISGVQFAHLFIIEPIEPLSFRPELGLNFENVDANLKCNSGKMPDPANVAESQRRSNLTSQQVFFWDVETQSRRFVNVAADNMLSYVACWQQPVILSAERSPGHAGALACLPIFTTKSGIHSGINSGISGENQGPGGKVLCGMLKLGKTGFAGDFREEETRALTTLCAKCYGISITACMQQQQLETSIVSLKQESRELRLKSTIATRTCGTIQAELSHKEKELVSAKESKATLEVTRKRLEAKSRILCSVLGCISTTGTNSRSTIERTMAAQFPAHDVRIMLKSPEKIRCGKSGGKGHADRDLSANNSGSCGGISEGYTESKSQEPGHWQREIWRPHDEFIEESKRCQYSEGRCHKREVEVVEEGDLCWLNVTFVYSFPVSHHGPNYRHAKAEDRTVLIRIAREGTAQFEDAEEVSFITELCGALVPTLVQREVEAEDFKTLALEERVLNSIRSRWQKFISQHSTCNGSTALPDSTEFLRNILQAALNIEDLTLMPAQDKVTSNAHCLQINIDSTMYHIGRENGQRVPDLVCKVLAACGRANSAISLLHRSYKVISLQEQVNAELERVKHESEKKRKAYSEMFLNLASSGSAKEAAQSLNSLGETLGFTEESRPQSLANLLQSSEDLEVEFLKFKKELATKTAQLRQLSQDAEYHTAAMADLLQPETSAGLATLASCQDQLHHVLSRFCLALLDRVNARKCWLTQQQSSEKTKIWLDGQPEILAPSSGLSHDGFLGLITLPDARMPLELLQAVGLRNPKNILIVPVAVSGAQPVIVYLTDLDVDVDVSTGREGKERDDRMEKETLISQAVQAVNILIAPVLYAIGLTTIEQNFADELNGALLPVLKAATFEEMDSAIASMHLVGLSFKLRNVDEEGAKLPQSGNYYEIGKQHLLCVSRATFIGGNKADDFAIQQKVGPIAQILCEMIRTKIQSLELSGICETLSENTSAAMQESEVLRDTLTQHREESALEKKQMETELAEAEKTKKKLEKLLRHAERDRVHSEKIEERALAEAAKLESAKNDLASQVEIKQQQIEAGRRDVETLKNVVSKLSAKLEEKRAVGKQEQDIRQNNDLESLAIVKAKLSQAEQRNEELLNNLTTADKQVLTLREALHQAASREDAAHREFRRKSQIWEVDKHELLARAKQLEECIKQLDVSNAELEERLTQAEETARKKQVEVDSHAALLAVANEKISSLEAEEKKKAAIVELRCAESERLEAALEEMRENAAKWKAKYDQMEQECFRYERERVLLVCKRRAEEEDRKATRIRKSAASKPRRRRART